MPQSQDNISRRAHRIATRSGDKTPESHAATHPRLMWQIVLATFFRLALNTARRFVYPFAPLLGRDLHVPLTAVTTLIAVNQTTGLVGVAVGPLTDRWGSRAAMRIAMVMLTAGMLLCAMAPIYGVVLASLVVTGLAKTLFDPAVQAFVGYKVPYARRAMAIGAIETAWAGSTLIGIPAMALVIDRFGLRWSFWVMAILGAAGYLVLSKVIPADADRMPEQSHASGMLSRLSQLIRQRPAAGMLGFAFWLCLGNDNLFVVFGAWLESDFGVSLLVLGFSSSIIGAAELLGESITALWADRMGPKRCVTVGMALAAVCYVSLPLLGNSMPTALLGLFLIFLTVEFSIVTSFSLSTELLPSARATMMAGVLAAAGAGRMVGALTGGVVWTAAGLWGVAGLSALATLAALGCLLWGLRGRGA